MWARLFRVRWLIQKIAAKLANIDNNRRALIGGIVPELAGREFPPKDDAGSGEQRDADPANPARAVIERQRDIDPVARRGAGRSDEALHHGLRAHIGQLGGLGHTGCAGRIDIETEIAAAQCLAVCAVRARVRHICQYRLEISHAGACAIKGPKRRRVLKQSLGVDCRGGLLWPGNDVFGVRDIDAMGQRLAFEIVIDHRGHDTDLGEAKPDRDIFRSVAHE